MIVVVVEQQPGRWNKKVEMGDWKKEKGGWESERNDKIEMEKKKE